MVSQTVEWNRRTGCSADQLTGSYSLFPALVVLVDAALPIASQRLAAAHSANGLAEHLVIERGAFAVAVVVHGTVGVDAKVTGSLHRVDVRAEEQEFPAVAALLPFNHLLDTVAAVMAAGVLHAVRCDHEQRVLRAILLAGVLVDVADVVNRAADGVQQRRAAARDIFPFAK